MSFEDDPQIMEFALCNYIIVYNNFGDKAVYFIDKNNLNLVKTIKTGHNSNIGFLKIKGLIYTKSVSDGLMLIDANSLKVQEVLSNLNDKKCFKVSPSERYIFAFSCSNQKGCLVDVNTMEVSMNLIVEQIDYNFINEFSPNDKYLGISYKQGRLNIFDTADYNVVLTLNDSRKLFGIKFSNNSKYVITASNEGSVEIRDMNNQNIIKSFIF